MNWLPVTLRLDQAHPLHEGLPDTRSGPIVEGWPAIRWDDTEIGCEGLHKETRDWMRGCADLGETVVRASTTTAEALRWGEAHAKAASSACEAAFGHAWWLRRTGTCTGLADCAPGHSCCETEEGSNLGALCLPTRGCPSPTQLELCHEGEPCAREGTACYYGQAQA